MIITNGTKYFKIIGDRLELIRVISNKNPTKIKCKDCNSGNKFTMTLNELEEYTRLNYDGVIQFTIVKVGSLEDVIVTLYRRDEIANYDSNPYCICRQSITDFFANSLSKDKRYYGISISKDSVPEGVEYNRIMACDGIEDSLSVAVYIDDTLDEIMSMVKSKVYDNVLYTLFADHIHYTYKNNKDTIKLKLMGDRCDGYCKTLKDLLIYNEFMYDFYTGFHIYPLKVDLSFIGDYGVLSNENRIAISFLLCKNITDSKIIKYSKDIDLDKISGDYILVSDKHNNLYIVLYAYKGKYHIPVEKVESLENLEKLKSIYPSTSSVYEAYNIIKFNGKKYV